MLNRVHTPGEVPAPTMAGAMTGGGAVAQEARTRTERLAAALRRPMAAWGAQGGDAVLYGVSGLFALATALGAGLAGYRVWGWLALGPYMGAAVVSAALARHESRRRSRAAGRAPSRRRAARSWVLVLALLGATVVPLSVEVSLRTASGTATHVQPEVVVIQQAGQRLADGKDPYHATVVHGRVRSAVPGEPTFESFFPYLPLMAVFGLPSSGHGPVRVTDTRILFTVVTLLVVGLALLLLLAPEDEKMRVLQFLTVLPSAALPLATGGDDMPIVALLLLAMALAQRRRPGWSGFVLGIASSMKFTAWPLAALALLCARGRDGRRAPGRMLLGMFVVAGPVVASFAATNLRAFFDNVVLFPLGLSGVTSPAASNLPGHLLVLHFPWLHAVLPLAVAAVGGTLLVRRLRTRPPATPAEVTMLAGWVMLVAIVFAPATRVGYLLYPVNFFVWSWALGRADRSKEAIGEPLMPLALA